MATQVVQLTSEERALCTLLSDLMHKGCFSSQHIGQLFSLSQHTVRSLVCTRRRPGPTVLERLEEGCAQLLIRAESPEARRFWWYLLDAAIRCAIFPMNDPAGRLRVLLRNDLQNGAVPDEFFDIRPEVWNAFDAGNPPSRGFLEVVIKSYRREAERLLIDEGEWEGALDCRSTALIAERLRLTTQDPGAAVSSQRSP